MMAIQRILKSMAAPAAEAGRSLRKRVRRPEVSEYSGRPGGFRGAGTRRAPRGRRYRGCAMRFGGLFRERSFYQSKAATSAYRGVRRAAAKAGLDIVVK